MSSKIINTVVIALLLTVAGLSADLGTRLELQTALYERLETTSADAFWDTALVNAMVNKAVNEVQLFLQCEKGMDTIGLTAQDYRYDAPSDIAQDGVLFAFLQKGGSNYPRRLRPIPYKLPGQFGQTTYDDIQELTIVKNEILLNGTPDGADSLYVWYYRISPYMDYDSSTVGLPAGYAGFALDLAYADAKRIRGYLQFWQQELQRIYAIMREVRERFPKAEPQSTGGL